MHLRAGIVCSNAQLCNLEIFFGEWFNFMAALNLFFFNKMYVKQLVNKYIEACSVRVIT